MYHDLIASIRVGLREFRRLRWLAQRGRHIKAPF